MERFIAPSISQKENTTHGLTVFPLQQYITLLNNTYPAVTMHWHDEAELTLVTSGNAIYQIALKEYAVFEGDLLFIQPRELHTITLSNTASFLSETYVFHMNYVGANGTDLCATKYLLPLSNKDYVLPCHIKTTHPAYASVREQFDRISRLYKKKTMGYELAIKGCMLQILFLLLPYGSSTQASHSDTASEKLKTALDYLQKNYAKPLSVKELAAQCYLSEYYFMRFFKKHMHMTVVAYLNNLRMEKAVELFEQGQTSIIEVSMSVGFHSLSYFHKVFREKFSMTPKQFLKQL